MVYDIGANVGYVSLSLAKQVGPRGTVFAFEPVPETFDLLRRNVELNKAANIKLLNIAASDSTGDALIRMTENVSMASMVWHQNDASASEISVKTVCVVELVEQGELEKPSFLKIDVEGAEGLVVRGMQNTLAQARPVVYLECSERGRDTTWRLLRHLGYRCQSPVTGKPVYNFDRYRHADFLWLPSEAAGR